MFVFRNMIAARIKKLDGLIKAKEDALAEAPEGSLRISHKGKTITYYNHNGGKNTYIKKSDWILIKKMGQKDYDLQVVEAARQERDALIELLHYYPEVSAEEVITDINPLRNDLIRPIIKPDDVFLNEWRSIPFVPKPIGDDIPLIITNNGERVRSKSEKIIADRYQYKGIRYKYECPLELAGGIVIHPDFTLMDINRRVEIYHEHCGKMDDVDYLKDLAPRIDLYERSGIFMGDRLFLTFETRRMGLKISAIDEIIRKIR